jgi:pyruvate formate lyase activating enzyme
MRQKVTRREFLQTALLAALGTGLGACADLPMPSETPVVRATQATTAAPTLTPTPEPTLAAKAPPTPTAVPDALADLHEARYYEQLDGKRVQCHMCFRQCLVPEGGRGFCRNKINVGGRYYTLVYGRPSALQVDPIEKEPCFHMLPGGTIFCTGTASCNNRCKFCHNWHLSQRTFEEIQHTPTSPQNTVAWARQLECDAVSFTYNEPTVFYEHMFDVAKLAKESGMHALFHTNGGISQEPLAELLVHMDAVTVDLKAFTPGFYRQVSSSELAPVLRTLQQIHESEVHLEMVNLVIPTLNDNLDDIRRMCQWIREALSDNVPLHFTRFHPAYKLASLPPTPIETLESAAQIADEEGLQYVYIGNVPGHERNSTFCPACDRKIIERVHFSVLSADVVKGTCRFCGHPIPGVWWDSPKAAAALTTGCTTQPPPEDCQA